MKLNLFQRLAKATREFTSGIQRAFKAFTEDGTAEATISEPTISEPVITEPRVEEKKPEIDYEARLERLKARYRDLFVRADAKYRTIEELGIEELSSAYQSAHYGFDIFDDISSMDELFREVARAQVFLADPSSNADVVKQLVDEMGIDLYKGRGNKDPEMQDFWKQVNMAKETSEVSSNLALKQYSGAFEYAYQVYKNTGSAYEVKEGLKKYLEETVNKPNEFTTTTEPFEIGSNESEYDYGDTRFM